MLNSLFDFPRLKPYAHKDLVLLDKASLPYVLDGFYKLIE